MAKDQVAETVETEATNTSRTANNALMKIENLTDQYLQFPIGKDGETLHLFSFMAGHEAPCIPKSKISKELEKAKTDGLIRITKKKDGE